MPHRNNGQIQRATPNDMKRTPPAGGLMPMSASDDPQMLTRMTTDAIAANEVVEALVWKAIYWAKSSDLYSSGPYRSPGNQQAFLESVHATCRQIAQHVLRAWQEGYVRGQNEGRGYIERQRDIPLG